MLFEKRDAIIRFHRAKKCPEETQHVINVIFYKENGFQSIRVGQSCNCFNNIFLLSLIFLVNLNKTNKNRIKL